MNEKHLGFVGKEASIFLSLLYLAPAVSVGFRKAYSYEYEIKHSFCKNDAARQQQVKQKEVI